MFKFNLSSLINADLIYFQLILKKLSPKSRVSFAKKNALLSNRLKEDNKYPRIFSLRLFVKNLLVVLVFKKFNGCEKLLSQKILKIII